jgi:hypothetical protein
VGLIFISVIDITNLWSQLVPLQDIDSLRDLDIGQKRTLICRELERSLTRTRNTADTLLGKQGVTPMFSVG